MFDFRPEFPGTPLAFSIVLAVLVFTHELGRYLASGWRPVRVEAFSIGFGRAAASWTDRLRAVPKAALFRDMQPSPTAASPLNEVAPRPLPSGRDAGERQRRFDMTDLAVIMVCDLRGTIRSWSEGCRRLYGWTAAEAIGRLSHELLQTICPVPRAEVEAALRVDGEWSGELRNRGRDGAEVIVSAQEVLHRNVRGEVSSVVEHMAVPCRIGGIAGPDQDLPGAALPVSEAFALRYGLPPGQTHVSEEEWLALVHPGELSRLDTELRNIRRPDGPLAARIAIPRSDGSVRWISLRAEVLPGQTGRLVHVTTAPQDSTQII